MGKLMFVRMNVVEAIPMTRKEYVESRGWELPANENPDDQVYKVVYADGYVSMCPKDKFDAVSIPCAEGCVPFGYAITECVYHGKRITRRGWNGEGSMSGSRPFFSSPTGSRRKVLRMARSRPPRNRHASCSTSRTATPARLAFRLAGLRRRPTSRRRIGWFSMSEEAIIYWNW